MQFGDLEVYTLSDGGFRYDAGGVFGLVPRKLYERYHIPRNDNTLAMALNCLLVRSRGKTILIDTGLGDKLDPEQIEWWGLARPKGGLLAGLSALGAVPEDVDVVINTHLHWDHCGGNTRRDGHNVVATFPRATYLIQRIEWSEAEHPDARTRGTYLAENFAPLLAEGRLELLHSDYDVTDQVRCVVTRGHTRAHQSMLLRSGEWLGMYVADMASYAVHMTHAAWVTAFDVEPLETIRTKERWQHWAVETGAWLFFEHDPETPIARLVERDGRLDVDPAG